MSEDSTERQSQAGSRHDPNDASGSMSEDSTERQSQAGSRHDPNDASVCMSEDSIERQSQAGGRDATQGVRKMPLNAQGKLGLQMCRAMGQAPSISQAGASWQESSLPLAGLGGGDLVDHDSNSTLGDNVGNAIAHLDGPC